MATMDKSRGKAPMAVGHVALAKAGTATSAPVGGFLSPYRAAGLVTDTIAPTVQRQGSETFVTTSAGRTFQIFTTAALRLRFVGPALPGRIRALESRGDHTFAAIGREVVVVHRADIVGTLRGHAHPVCFVLWVGDALVTICSGLQLNAWLVTGDQADFDVPVSTASLSPDLTPSAAFHPATYLNKLVVGSEEGPMELWNIRKGRPVHRFKGWGSAVRCLAQSTAVDVAAVGLQSGRVVLHNLRLDQAVLSFRMDGGAITAIAFRTDRLPVMASASDQGHLALWHLEEGRLVSLQAFAHEEAITLAHFLPREPVLLTAGCDNSICMWIFDRPGGGARLLRSRSGHSAPPRVVRFYADPMTGSGQAAAGAADLLSAGADRALRRTSLWVQRRDAELSQGHVIAKARKLGRLTRPSALKLPPIVDMSASRLRERDWPNLVTCHEGHGSAATWHVQRRALTKLNLAPVAGATAGEVTAACASPCGNFAFIGTAAGNVDKFNLQSGLHRASFGAGEGGGHRGAVRGLVVEASQRMLVSAGQDGTVRTWNLANALEVSCLYTGSPVAKLCAAGETDLAAVACDDMSAQVFDLRSASLVRHFGDHESAILDLAFTPDGRALLTTTRRGSLRLFDLPSARLVAWHSLRMAATSVAWSPRGEFLATTHAGCVAICVWANRTIFAGERLEAEVTQPTLLDMPAAAFGNDDDEGDEEEAEDGGVAGHANGGSVSALSTAAALHAEEAAAREALRKSAEKMQLADGLLTLSGVPSAVWKSLVVLDQIKARNKPEEPPEAPPEAPFFLATVPGLEPAFRPPDAPDQGSSKVAPALRKKGSVHGLGSSPALLRYVLDDEASGSFGAAAPPPARAPCCSRASALTARCTACAGLTAEYIRGLKPAEADLQIRLLDDGSGEVRSARPPAEMAACAQSVSVLL